MGAVLAQSLDSTPRAAARHASLFDAKPRERSQADVRSAAAKKKIIALETANSEDDGAIRELLSCAIPEAKAVPYSPFDGGESVGKIITKCWKEALAFVDDCVKTKSSHEDGHDKEVCQLIAAMTIQAAIKRFGR
jgi:hypothetical protein